MLANHARLRHHEMKDKYTADKNHPLHHTSYICTTFSSHFILISSIEVTQLPQETATFANQYRFK